MMSVSSPRFCLGDWLFQACARRLFWFLQSPALFVVALFCMHLLAATLHIFVESISLLLLLFICFVLKSQELCREFV